MLRSSWGNTKHRPPVGANILILQLNSTLLDVSENIQGEKQSHEEVQKSIFLSEHLNYNMLKGYYGFFAQWCQKYTAYWRFKIKNSQSKLVVFVYYA